MATNSTPTLNGLADDICEGFASLPGATLSGIVGDRAHARAGGYHISREDQVNANDYSIRLPIDKQGPSNCAAAIDRSMPTSSMVVAWNRWMVVFNDAGHPARKYVREYIGWNGVGMAERLDFANGTRGVTTDDSHKWHDHRSLYRAYVNDPEMRRVVALTEAGESAAVIRGEYNTEGTTVKFIYASGRKWALVGDRFTEVQTQAQANSIAGVFGNALIISATDYDNIKAAYDAAQTEGN